MKGIKITKCQLKDVRSLAHLGRTTFKESFAEFNTRENIQNYLEDNFSVEIIEAQLKKHKSEFFFANISNYPIGYIKLNWDESQTDLKQTTTGLEIERIYVKKNYQGLKIGKLLFEVALKLAKDKKKKFIWLGVWEENRKAILFYETLGFKKFDTHEFYLGDEKQTDVMMKFNIVA